jgi:hypothetical protein
MPLDNRLQTNTAVDGTINSSARTMEERKQTNSTSIVSAGGCGLSIWLLRSAATNTHLAFQHDAVDRGRASDRDAPRASCSMMFFQKGTNGSATK